jgi:hypothetical protein
MAETKSWQQMRDWQADLLSRRTGVGLTEWNERVRLADPPDESTLRAWLSEQGVTGYAQMLLVMERFGYPDFLLATADALIDGQYADRPALRPIFDAVLAYVAGLGEVTVQARKTYVSLVGPRRTFAAVVPSTRRRVDVALRLPDGEASGRLLTSGNLGNSAMTHRLPLSTVDEFDDEAKRILARAYEANT